MPRPRKTGLDYFYKDVHDWDEIAIMELMQKYGPTGYCVYDVVLSKVYANGYFLEIPLDVLACYVVRAIGNRWLRDKDMALQVIEYCAEIGLFDYNLMKRSVVTSVEIQRHYSQVTARSKADKSKYWLLDNGDCADKTNCVNNPAEKPEIYTNEVQPFINGVSAAKTPEKTAEMQQTKENKTKVNESKVNESKANESKANESKANESKANESKANESIANESKVNESKANESKVNESIANKTKEYESIANESIAESESCFSAAADADADAATKRIENAFAAVTGRRFRHSDILAIEEMYLFGADSETIINVINDIGRRGIKDIGSMRYFLPIVRNEMKQINKNRSGRNIPQRIRTNEEKGFLPETSDTAQIEAVLDAEWLATISKYKSAPDDKFV